MGYYMNNHKAVKRGDIFYIANSKCYATDPSNTAGRPGIIVSSDKLNEHADVVEVEREEDTADTPVVVERNLYKTLYENLLNKVMAR